MLGQEELKEEIRFRLGNPSETELPDEAIDVIIDKSLNNLNEVRPAYLYEELKVTKNKQSYIIDNEEVIKVVDVWFPKEGYSLDDSVASIETGNRTFQVTASKDFVGISVFDNPSLRRLIEEKVKSRSLRSPQSWEYNEDTRELKLIPPPRRNGKIVYKGTKSRDFNDIPDSIAGPFKDLVEANALSMLANTRSRVRSMPVGIGSMQFDTRVIVEKAENLRLEALAKLRRSGGSSPIITG